jgi:hypothetical protein
MEGGFYMSFIKGLFEGYKEARDPLDKRFNELEWTPFLMNTNDLGKLVNYCNEDQLDHLEKYLIKFQKSHDIFEVDSFADVYLDVLEKKEAYQDKRKRYAKRMNIREQKISNLRGF